MPMLAESQLSILTLILKPHDALAVPFLETMPLQKQKGSQVGEEQDLAFCEYFERYLSENIGRLRQCLA